MPAQAPLRKTSVPVADTSPAPDGVAPEAEGASPPETWSLYLVRARNGSLYTGIAKEVEKRIAAHNAGKGSKSLRALGLPVALAYREAVGDYSAALRREAAVKKWPRERKEALVAGYLLPTKDTLLPVTHHPRP